MENYREILKDEFLKRKQKNESYSLRAFASSLGLSIAGLSQILSGKKELSIERAIEVARKLKLDPEKTESLVIQVQYARAKSPELKKHYSREFEQRFGATETHDLNLEQFMLLNQWYGLAIYESLKHPEMKTARAIASALGLDLDLVKESLKRLSHLGVVRCHTNGTLERSAERLVFHSAYLDEAIQKYFHSVFQHAQSVIQNLESKRYVASSEVLTFHPDQMKEVKKLTDQYWAKIQKLSRETSSSAPVMVYQGVHMMFPISKDLNDSKNFRKGNSK